MDAFKPSSTHSTDPTTNPPLDVCLTFVPCMADRSLSQITSPFVEIFVIKPLDPSEISQVKIFKELIDVTGLVMTKLDGTAKGGVLVALADQFALPIHAIGVGEQIDDLSPFDPKEFASALLGIDY